MVDIKELEKKRERFLESMKRKGEAFHDQIERIEEKVETLSENKQSIWKRQRRDFDRRYDLFLKDLDKVTKASAEEWEKKVWHVKSTYGFLRQKVMDMIATAR